MTHDAGSDANVFVAVMSFEVCGFDACASIWQVNTRRAASVPNSRRWQ